MIIKIIVLLLQSKDDITWYQENTGSKKSVKKSSGKNLRKLCTNKTRTWEEKFTPPKFLGNGTSLILSYHLRETRPKFTESDWLGWQKIKTF